MSGHHDIVVHSKCIADELAEYKRNQFSLQGDGTLSLRTADKWLRRFRAGENDTMDKPAGGRPVTTNTDEIMENIEVDRHVTSRDNIAEDIGVSHQTVLNHLQKAGYKKKLDVWVPHDLTQKTCWTESTPAICC
ncbi:histone-lysine N-methyltransferase SETMAR-like [Drosophila rhopaloa]|uniref:Histone-lysine N-methyltransferase SETMAR-like n=1 Tax=Drosophila rhopaloa TaxID=1041015 RepID=A0ABM5J129_DRORH|nr:histone-lysine N-methyltransferase SETMAR-like [Drosophila rhopaloa]